VSVLAVFFFVNEIGILPIDGKSFTALTVKVNVCAEESTVPSLTLAVMVALPFQLAAGVRVIVELETLTTTFAVDEVAE
jgi:hypothetical protein